MLLTSKIIIYEKDSTVFCIPFSVGLVFAQQIGNGYAQTINSFNSVLNTGIYDSDKAQINYPYEVPHWP